MLALGLAARCARAAGARRRIARAAARRTRRRSRSCARSRRAARPTPTAPMRGSSSCRRSCASYLEQRYDIRAPELTTEEFLQVASRAARADGRASHAALAFLERCDRVKFAGYRPDAEESIDTLAAARAFVEDTRLRERARSPATAAPHDRRPLARRRVRAPVVPARARCSRCPRVWWSRRVAGPRRVLVAARAARSAARPGARGSRGCPTRCSRSRSIALAIALAGPRAGDKSARVRREGIAIMMAVDVSGSMRALDLSEQEPRADPARRGQAGVRAVRARRQAASTAGPTTRSAWSRSRATPIRAARSRSTTATSSPPRASSTSRAQDEDGTAIGAGLELAVAAARRVQGARARSSILLTDGESNVHDIDEDTAIDDAVKAGVKVYTIGAGTNGVAPIRVDRGDGRSELMQMQVSIDETTLRKIADKTGGQYFRATDNASLRRSTSRSTSSSARRSRRSGSPSTTSSTAGSSWPRWRSSSLAFAAARHRAAEAAVTRSSTGRPLHPERIHLVWLALAIVGVLVRARAARARRAVDVPVAGDAAPADRAGELRAHGRCGSACSLLALLAGVGALMRPQAPRRDRDGHRVAGIGRRHVRARRLALDARRGRRAEPARAREGRDQPARRPARGSSRRPGRVRRPRRAGVPADARPLVLHDRAVDGRHAQRRQGRHAASARRSRPRCAASRPGRARS